MKKSVIVLLSALITLGSCSAQSSKKPDEKSPVSNTTNNAKNMGTIHLTKQTFLEKVVNYETSPNDWKYLGDKPCIIDFYADWCGPCKAVAPILEELAKTYGDQIYIYKIDTDKEQELAGVFGIRSIPSILFVPMDGKPQMSMGALPKQQLVEAIETILLAKKP
jgi:thioredoxin